MNVAVITPNNNTGSVFKRCTLTNTLGTWTLAEEHYNVTVLEAGENVKHAAKEYEAGKNNKSYQKDKREVGNIEYLRIQRSCLLNCGNRITIKILLCLFWKLAIL